MRSLTVAHPDTSQVHAVHQSPAHRLYFWLNSFCRTQTRSRRLKKKQKFVYRHRCIGVLVTVLYRLRDSELCQRIIGIGGDSVRFVAGEAKFGIHIFVPAHC